MDCQHARVTSGHRNEDVRVRSCKSGDLVGQRCCCRVMTNDDELFDVVALLGEVFEPLLVSETEVVIHHETGDDNTWLGVLLNPCTPEESL